MWNESKKMANIFEGEKIFVRMSGKIVKDVTIFKEILDLTFDRIKGGW